MIAINAELLRQMKMESVILREFSGIAKKLSDNEEYSGLKHLIDTVNVHANDLAKLFERFDAEMKELNAAAANAKSSMKVTTVNLADTKPAGKPATKPMLKKEARGGSEA